jgi:hypothetical protein
MDVMVQRLSAWNTKHLIQSESIPRREVETYVKDSRDRKNTPILSDGR